MKQRLSYVVVLFIILFDISICYAHSGRTNSDGCHNSSTGYHCHSDKPNPTPDKPNPSKPVSPYNCTQTKQCREIRTCEEAKFYFSQCGQTDLDRDGDNTPCESLCGVSGTPELELSEPVESNNGYLVTDKIWIKSEIITEELGAIQGLWKTGGGAITSRGDQVIWGYFYAGSDVVWGNLNNPEVFAKLWFDVNGRTDINYFHVSVPDIDVFSVQDNSDLLTSRATLKTRYIRHFFENDGRAGSNVINTDNANIIRESNKFQADKITAFVGASVNTDDGEQIIAQYKKGGQAISVRGDHVFWGYFYVDPKHVSWGNYNNPEVFVKIWFDISGRIDVNFFHVSVPDIEVRSSIGITDATTPIKSSSLTLERRYARHEYVK